MGKIYTAIKFDEWKLELAVRERFYFLARVLSKTFRFSSFVKWKREVKKIFVPIIAR